jgi:hypothetical protein
MFNWIQKITSPRPIEEEIIGRHAKRELIDQIEQLLLEHHTQHGADSLLNPQLRVVAIHDRITLETESIPDAICEVMLRELPTVLSFIVVREDNLAIPRDVVINIAYEASRLISKRINLLAESN